ncbi:MAG: hypothetical protein KC776_07740 [Myxococcales bacterium]|nr:hypothetical protein [Myxococcales bacterium]MCB9583496.1 hypothetical protein [Polyangiaceae bacterium]
MARQRERLYSLIEVVAEGARVQDFGRAAVALADAQRRGLPVAPGWVLPTTAFREVVDGALPPGHDPASLLRSIHKPSGVERAARARERLATGSLPQGVLDVFGELLSEQGAPEWGWVLRPSVNVADDTLVTLAGLDLAELVPGGIDEVARAVRELWARAFEERVLHTLRDRKVRDFAIGIVIQRQEAAVAHGLALSVEPARLWRFSPELNDDPRAESGEAGPWAVVAAHGARASVVDGVALRDALVLEHDGAERAVSIANKPTAIVIEDGKVTHADVEPARRRELALTPSARADLDSAVKRLDATEPVVVEFDVTRGATLRVVAVQSAVGQGFPSGGAADTVWSRSGLDALLPRVPTPLTGALIERFSEASLRNAVRELGGKMSRSAQLVMSVHGRPYFNLSALLPVARTLPGIDPHSLLELVRGAADDDVAAALGAQWKSPSLAALSLAAARLLARQKRLSDEVTRYEREAEQQRRWLAEMDLAILPDDSLKTTLRETQAFFRQTARLLLGSTLTSLSVHLVLRALIARSLPAEASRLAHAVTAGVGELETSKPALALSHVTEILRADAPAKDAILSGASDVAALPAGPGKKALLSWFDAYGDHAVVEAELASPRWFETPGAVLSMVAAALGSLAVDSEQRMSHVRVDADRELATLEAQLSYVEAVLLRSLVTRSRALLRLREQMRAWFARTVAMMRRVVLDVDRRLCRLDSRLPRGAAFFCTPLELSSAVGNSRADLAAIVLSRKASWQRDQMRADPPEIFVGCAPPFSVPSSRALSGEPTSGKAATGVVRIVDGQRSPAHPGQVLVMRSLDVGFAPQFVNAAALVAECGGTLSHGAVLARELGVPAVVGVADARTVLEDGDRVRVDGERGVVERVTE